MKQLALSTIKQLSMLLFLAASGAGASACTKSDDAEIKSSQTHWLSRCETNEDCGGLDCLCGVCTQSCDSAAACDDLSAEASCGSSAAISACGEDSPAKICLASCDTKDDCGDGASCVSGACAPSPAPGGPGGGDDTPPPDDAPDPVDDTPAGPPGVQCADYPSCDADNPCEKGDCMSLVGCDSAICIDATEACEQSCPDPKTCRILESYPSQLACEGRVDAVGGGETDAGMSEVPAGVQCADYPTCSVDGAPCAEGTTCISIDGCSSAICIAPQEACDLSCYTPEPCGLSKSFPAQLACGKTVPGVAPGACVADGKEGCSAGGACCDGLQCCEGIPYPADGRCQTECLAKSDRDGKHNIQSVDPDRVLERVSSLPMSTWSYNEEPGVRHMGPMAQDFRAAFELGKDERTIFPVDAAGVALTAIQALNRRVEALEQENAKLRALVLERK